MDQLTNAKAMEENLRTGIAAIQNLGDAIRSYSAVQAQMAQLRDYYQSPQWHLDKAACAMGQLPGVDANLYDDELLQYLLRENEKLLQLLSQWANN